MFSKSENMALYLVRYLGMLTAYSQGSDWIDNSLLKESYCSLYVKHGTSKIKPMLPENFSLQPRRNFTLCILIIFFPYTFFLAFGTPWKGAVRWFDSISFTKSWQKFLSYIQSKEYQLERPRNHRMVTVHSMFSLHN